MQLKERALLIQKLLDEYFPDPPIPLTHKDPYTLLIAVLLSARCTDVRVNKVTPALFALADTPEKMSKLDVATIQNIIRICGLSERKATAIKELSKILVERYNSQVPKSIEELEELPGVGHKTASVVMAQCFKVDAFPVDTHIHRLAKRWGLSKAKNVAMTERDLKKIFPKHTWIKLHLQIIYYARTFCPAIGHVVADCPICSALQRKN